MGLGKDLRAEVKCILQDKWKVRDGNVVPSNELVALGNEGVRLNATVLYADIDGSTFMVDNYTPEFAAEVYKSYLLCAARIVREQNGVIIAYDGDRIMAVFVGKQKNTCAVRTGLKIAGAVERIINPAIQLSYKTDFVLKQSVGIDCSSLLAARTGIRGSNDLVWVGRAANYAAKLSGISIQPYSTYITKKVHDAMLAEVSIASDGQSMWNKKVWKNVPVFCSSWFWRI